MNDCFSEFDNKNTLITLSLTCNVNSLKVRFLSKKVIMMQIFCSKDINPHEDIVSFCLMFGMLYINDNLAIHNLYQMYILRI